MKKIITALLNETVNKKLSTYKKIQVIMKDIQYQEGIFEALEINPKIEFIILSELLPGEFKIKELIEKIKQIKKEIKIIIILEKQNEELENFLLAKGNIKIFYNNEIEIKEIVNIICYEDKNKELKLEIQRLKKIINDKKENIECEKVDSEKIKYEVNNEISKKIDNEVNNEISKKIYNEVNNEISKKINNRVNNEISKKINNERNNRISNAINNGMNNEIGNRINNAIKNKTNNKIKYKLNRKINNNRVVIQKIKERKRETTITENQKRQIEKEIEEEYRNKEIKNRLTKNKIIEQIRNIFKKKNIINKSKLIIISGIAGIGKSIFTINLVKALEKQKKKIVVIDFDFINNSISILFGIERKIKEEKNRIEIQEDKKEINEVNDFEYIKQLSGINKLKQNNIKTQKSKSDFINKNNNGINNKRDIKNEIEKITIEINSNTKLISNITTIFKENKIEDLQLLKIIKELKAKYDFIIIDTNSENNNYLSSIVDEIHKLIIITEPNILQIKKSKNFLDKNIKEINIEKEKIYILINKVKNDSLSLNILKEVFKEYNIIGKINFINNYNALINQNMNNLFLEKKIKEQYKKIAKRINENNKIKEYYIEKINTT